MNYIYKYFDELSWAKIILDRERFPDAATNKELRIMAKYFRKQIAENLDMSLEEINEDYGLMKEVSQEVEKRLIEFCEKSIDFFDYYAYCMAIERAVRISEKFYANENKPTPITKNEWETIQAIEDEDSRKLLFFRLVDAKYNAANRKTIGRYHYNDTEFFNREQLRTEMYCREMQITRKNFRKANQNLHEKGFVEFKQIFNKKRGGKYLEKVMIVDTDPDAEIIDYITDYHNILLHYDRLNGANIGTCKECGKLFRQAAGRNKYKYCEEHRIASQRKKDKSNVKLPKAMKKDKIKYQHCFVCNKMFELPSRGNTSKIVCCPKCQERRNKQKRIEWMRQKRKETATL